LSKFGDITYLDISRQKVSMSPSFKHSLEFS
jgi:hypothetical protein